MNTVGISHEELLALLSYNPDSGVFLWKKRVAIGTGSGAVAGGISRIGYRVIQLAGRLTSAHRIAWFYMTGVWPANDIDHINGVRDDNRWCNLREATRAENMQNQRRAQKHNKCGFLGVHPTEKGFRACIRKNGKLHHLGYFSTPELAHGAYLVAKKAMHPFSTLEVKQ